MNNRTGNAFYGSLSKGRESIFVLITRRQLNIHILLLSRYMASLFIHVRRDGLGWEIFFELEKWIASIWAVPFTENGLFFGHSPASASVC